MNTLPYYDLCSMPSGTEVASMLTLLMTCVLTPQAQTNESRAEAEASDASEKLWQRMQNSRQARGNPCENTKKNSQNILIQ